MRSLTDIAYRWRTEGRKPILMTPSEMDILCDILTGNQITFMSRHIKALCDRHHVPVFKTASGWRL